MGLAAARQLLAFLIASAFVLHATCIPTATSKEAQRKTQAAGPAIDLDLFKRAGCDNFTGAAWQPLRPAYHITVPYGWMNDPHGMFELNGTVHLFFQYNPRALAWDAPFWGHVVSKDLAHWTWLPPALLPDTIYDFNGVWSGAATVTDTGLPVLTYSAASTFSPEMGNYFQRQAMAVPADIKDPLLKTWIKPSTNPFLVQVPPGGTNFQFRDPTEGRHAVWQALISSDNPKPLNKSHFALAVGVQAYCMGGAGIYTAPTMAGPWSYQGSLYNQLVPEPQVNGQCMSSRADSKLSAWYGPAYGGPCDQFGAYCRMWEVVDFAELEQGVYFLKWDDQSHFRDLFSMEWYVLGNGPWDYAAVHPDLAHDASPAQQSAGSFGAQYSGYPNETSGLGKGPQSTSQRPDDDFNEVDDWEKSVTRSLFTGKIDGQRFAPMRTDYGSVYASMVFRTEDMRQVMFSWIYESAAGCKFMCSDEMPDPIQRQGFKGVQTMPRQLNYEPITKTLKAYPVKEMEKLRGDQVYNASNSEVATFPSTSQLVKVSTVPAGNLSASTTFARQLEVQAKFTLLPPGSSSTGNPKVANEKGTRTGKSDIVKQPDEFAAGIRIELGNGTFTDVYLKGTVESLAPQSPAYKISSLSLWVDRRQAGSGTNTTFMEGGPVPLPVDQDKAWLAPDEPLTLSVWVDHGIIEAFAMQGLARVTSRIYPSDDTVAWGISAWSIPPEPTAGIAVDRAAAARAAETLRPPSIITAAYCWWCRLWTSSCKDARCYNTVSRWPKPGDWGFTFDATVWEVKSAWLDPSC